MVIMPSILAKQTMGRVIALVLVCHIALGCVGHTVRAEEPVPPAADETIQAAPSDPQETEGLEGVAVYYAKRFQGRRTNSGQIFNHNKLTAAHPSLPYGTRVKVINLANDKSVVVTVNDRCRKRGYEIIDLTRKAAQELGFYGKGSARVKIIPLSDE